MLVHKYNILLQFFFKLMHTSHDFIATKTCPNYEFLAVIAQVRFETEKVRVRVGMVCS